MSAANPNARRNRKRPRSGSLRSASACLAPALLCALGLVAGARAESPAQCATEPDDARRLACYDRLFRTPPQAPPAAPPTGQGLAVPAPPRVPAAPVATESLVPGSALSRAWELDRAHKRGTFVVRTYLPNFLLPAHYTDPVNRAPTSPTLGTARAHPNDRQLGAKLQISLRAKAAEGLLLPDADLWLAYTQRSLWQLWNHEDSSPFRSTDYQPETIYVVPVPEAYRLLPAGWQWRMVQLGVAHQSNGQSDPLSRSWNRVYLETAFVRGELGLQVSMARRLRERGDDDNPDLVDHIGQTQLQLSWLPGLATASVTWRTDIRSLRRGSVQLDWTFPVDTDQPEGLRWYAQLFSGYGETLLDYNHRQTSFGLGLTLFQF